MVRAVLEPSPSRLVKHAGAPTGMRTCIPRSGVLARQAFLKPLLFQQYDVRGMRTLAAGKNHENGRLETPTPNLALHNNDYKGKFRSYKE